MVGLFSKTFPVLLVIQVFKYSDIGGMFTFQVHTLE